MHLHRDCPSCKARLRIREDMIGRKVACPMCRTRFTVEEKPPPVVIDPPPALRVHSPRVFISHAHTDGAFVERTIKPLLERHGAETWVSKEDIRTGEHWPSATQNAVHENDWFLVVLSPRSAQSEWVHKEVTLALTHKPHRILSVLMEPCDIHAFPANLAALHFVDFTENAEAAGSKLIADMVRQLNKEAREHRAQVEELSQSCEELKEENDELHQRQQEVQDRLDAVLAFDGNWTQPPSADVPLFRPLPDRRAPIIAVANLKGGVGKTTLTANLAASLWSGDPKQRVLMLDLDYQANLTRSCLDRRTIVRLRQQARFVQALFGDGPPDPQTVVRCAEPILGDREKATEGCLVGCDELLGVAETHALMRWLAGLGHGDVRFRLRSVLHSEEVQRDYQCILLDCPPRLTTTCINALVAADFVLIPVLLDEKSTEGAPRLLRWLRERRKSLFTGLAGVGSWPTRRRAPVVKRTNGTS